VTTLRVGVASIIQETNTFAPNLTDIDNFTGQGLWFGDEAIRRTAGVNCEFTGAVEQLESDGIAPVPLVRAWALASGRLTDETLLVLIDHLQSTLLAAGELDGVVLCLHGALASEASDCADSDLVAAARAVVGYSCPIVVTLDLHANVTASMIEGCDAVVGFKTYPHIDQSKTGAQAARIMKAILNDPEIVETVAAKRPMLVPAESQSTTDGPLVEAVRLAEQAISDSILDVSIFPVQPWLDVEELGLAVTVTHLGDREAAMSIAEEIATNIWGRRHQFAVELVPVEEAIARASRSFEMAHGLTLLVHSSDSPTAGAAADSPLLLRSVLKSASTPPCLLTLVDPDVARMCQSLAPNDLLETVVGASLETRWARPLSLEAVLLDRGSGSVRLNGAVMEGQDVSVGAWAVLQCGHHRVLVTEEPTPTFDPAGYESFGVSLDGIAAVEVRSANLFRSGWHGRYANAIFLDLPGASTPRLETLEFHRAPAVFPLVDAVLEA